MVLQYDYANRYYCLKGGCRRKRRTTQPGPAASAFECSYKDGTTEPVTVYNTHYFPKEEDPYASDPTYTTMLCDTTTTLYGLLAAEKGYRTDQLTAPLKGWTFTVVDVHSSLCPSIYDPNVRCAWAGKLTLDVLLDESIPLRLESDDVAQNKGLLPVRASTGHFVTLQGLKPLLLNERLYLCVQVGIGY